MPNFADPRASFITLPPVGYVGGLRGWERIAEAVKARPGAVALVPDKEPDRAGSILLPENAAMNRKPDLGTVVSSGEPDIEPGDRMLYAPWAGLWFRPFRIGGYKVRDLRFYGMPDGGMDPLRQVREPLQDVLPAKVGEDGMIRPIRDVVLIRRDKAAVGSMGLELPDEAKRRNLKATVVQAGPLASVGDERLEPGMRVVYNPSAVAIGLASLGETAMLEGDANDYALTRAGSILAVIREEVKE